MHQVIISILSIELQTPNSHSVNSLRTSQGKPSPISHCLSIMSLLFTMQTTPWYETNFPWKYFFNAYNAVHTQKSTSSLPRKGKKKSINIEEVKENKPYLEEAYLNCTIMNRSEIQEVLTKPEGVDYNEWIATHTLGHFNTINLLYGCISEVCTATTCPMMSAPGGLPYSWQEEKGKKTKTLIPAPQYIDYVMTYVEKHVQDNTVFPSKFGMVFPGHFTTIVTKIEKLLFHVLVHLFFAHYLDMVSLGLHPHLNCVFINFVLFNKEFNSLDSKEMAPLEDLAQAMGLVTQDSTTTSANSGS